MPEIRFSQIDGAPVSLFDAIPKCKKPEIRDGSSEFDDNSSGNIAFNHMPGGSNVLYMDGHAEWVKYPAKFPISNTEDVIKDNSHHGLG